MGRTLAIEFPNLTGIPKVFLSLLGEADLKKADKNQDGQLQAGEVDAAVRFVLENYQKFAPQAKKQVQDPKVFAQDLTKAGIKAQEGAKALTGKARTDANQTAKKYFQMAVEVDNKNATAHRKLAEFLYADKTSQSKKVKQQNLQRAREHLNQAIQCENQAQGLSEIVQVVEKFDPNFEPDVMKAKDIAVMGWGVSTVIGYALAKAKTFYETREIEVNRSAEVAKAQGKTQKE